jgi:hypothetical protein
MAKRRRWPSALSRALPCALPCALLAAGCELGAATSDAGLGEDAASPREGYADRVIEAPGATGEAFGDPTRATNGVRGGGAAQQSLDVYSIRPGAWLVLGWSGRRLVDGPGPDLAVFENPFEYGDGLTFVDAAVVELSADGERWVAPQHDYRAADERVYSAQRSDWSGFAGVTPVSLNEDEQARDPFDPAAGGDLFDLATLPDSPEADTIRAEGARFVRISPASDHLNPDTGEPFPRDPVSDGPDIDGVAGRYFAEGP